MEKNNQPLVSVVIPCYNHEQFVQDSIQSVIDQSYQNIELIIIDDGSKDSSVKMIEQMIPVCVQRFIRFEFRNRSNKGLSETLNEALVWCEGEYYSVIASDDMMYQDKTENQLKQLLEDKDAIGIFGKATLIDNHNNSVGVFGLNGKKIYFDDLFNGNDYVIASTQFLKMDRVRDIGYKSGFILEDWYILVKLLENGGYLIQSDNVYSYYRQHLTNISKNRYKMLLGGVQVYNEFLYHECIDDKFMKLGWEFVIGNFRLGVFRNLSHFFKVILRKIKIILAG